MLLARRAHDRTVHRFIECGWAVAAAAVWVRVAGVGPASAALPLSVIVYEASAVLSRAAFIVPCSIHRPVQHSFSHQVLGPWTFPPPCPLFFTHTPTRSANCRSSHKLNCSCMASYTSFFMLHPILFNPTLFNKTDLVIFCACVARAWTQPGCYCAIYLPTRRGGEPAPQASRDRLHT